MNDDPVEFTEEDYARVFSERCPIRYVSQADLDAKIDPNDCEPIRVDNPLPASDKYLFLVSRDTLAAIEELCADDGADEPIIAKAE